MKRPFSRPVVLVLSILTFVLIAASYAVSYAIGLYGLRWVLRALGVI